MKKTRNKITGLLLAAAMLASTVGVFGLTAGAEAAEEVTVTLDTHTSVTLKDTDADGYYDIGNADELYAFAAHVNAGNADINGELTDNIELNPYYTFTYNDRYGLVEVREGEAFRAFLGTGIMGEKTVGTAPSIAGEVYDMNGTITNADIIGGIRSWTPIGKDADAPFNGAFNGNGKSVSGVFVRGDNDYQGLFGYVSNINVCYVTVDNSYIKGRSFIGGVVGALNNGSIEYCTTQDTYVGGSGDSVGGMVGSISSGIVDSCTNQGTVYGNSQVGGMVGLLKSGTVKDCTKNGSVGGDSQVGGIVGMNEHGTVQNCIGTRAVSGNSQIGGIVGNNQGVVFNCSNRSNVVIGTNSDVGGVVGNNSGTVQNCYNTGGIRSLSSSEGNCFGGVVGNNSGTVSVCYNEGEVLGYQYVGGVAGYSDDNSADSFVKSCYSIGSVSGESDIGGVLGNGGNASDCCYLSDSETDSHSGTTAMTSAQFASGEVAYLLNGDQTTIAWGQNLASSDEYPEFADYSKNVYKNVFCDGSVEYSNTQVAEGTHKDVNSYGYCSACQVKIASASVTIGKDLTMNYYVDIIDETLLADIQNISMRFTSGNKSMTVAPDEQRTDENGLYILSFTKIPPQCMSDNIKAELLLGETVIASKDEYSVKQNLSNLLKNNADDEKLSQLITDMLAYGAASQNYRDYNLEDLANENVENIGTPSSRIPEKTDKTVTVHVETLGDVRFTSATVRFDNVNKIGVKLSTTENVKLVVKIGDENEGTTYENLESTTFYTDAIYATEFDTVYTFELYEGETLVQTFTYSVSSYVYAMQNSENAEMKDLANALYNYGVSAALYNCTHSDTSLGIDYKYHWNTCGFCGESVDKEEHSLTSGVCTVCEAEVYEEDDTWVVEYVVDGETSITVDTYDKDGNFLSRSYRLVFEGYAPDSDDSEFGEP